MRYDPSLYVLVDPDQCGRHDPVALAVAAAAGGAMLVQLRDKGDDIRRTIALARALVEKLAPAGVPVLVNDRVDAALAAGAAGVHLGQSDMDVRDARRLLGPRAIIGQTVKTAHEAAALARGAVDYAAVGGVFATASKANPAPPIGLDGLAAQVRALRAHAPGLPVVAIAGIDAANAGAVVWAGADGVCVISAVARAADPAEAARELRAVVDRAKVQRAPEGGRT